MAEDPKLQQNRRTLLDTLARQGIHDARVLGALGEVPREEFVPTSCRSRAYQNLALPISSDQTISQPYIVALMTQELELEGTERVLEIGTGSGYQAAVLARLAREVFTVERLAALSETAQSTLERLGVRNVHFRVGDGTLGWEEEAPFDRVIVTAMASRVPPNLFEQLTEGGILIMPVGSRSHQDLRAYRRFGDQFQERHLCKCRFVPLIGEDDKVTR